MPLNDPLCSARAPIVASLALAALALSPHVLGAGQAGTAPSTGSTPAAGSAQAVAQRLQERYNRIRDFQADFVQTMGGGGLFKSEPGEGHVYVKRPGRMRWVYTKPDKQELIWDGKKIYQYSAKDKQASVSYVSAENDTSIGVMFLSGKGDIVRDFTPSLAPITQPGTIALKLTPKQAGGDNDSFVVVIDDKTSRLQSFTSSDSQGGQTTTRFINLKEDTGISDNTFVFSPPKGTVILGEPGGR